MIHTVYARSNLPRSVLNRLNRESECIYTSVKVKHYVCIILISVVAFAISITSVHAQEPVTIADYVAWSPNGQQIAASGTFGIRLYTPQLQLLPIQFANAGAVAGIAWSPDSSKIASAHVDYSVRVWDAQTGNLLKRLEGHTNGVLDVAWSPDGSKLGSASTDNTARLWDVSSGATLHILSNGKSNADAIGWSPDGTKVATTGGRLRIWNTQNGTSLVDGPGVSLHPLSWSSDGQTIFVGGFSSDAATAQDNNATECGAGSAASAGTVASHAAVRAIASYHSGGAGVCIEDITSPVPKIISVIGSENPLVTVALNADGSQIVGSDGYGHLTVWNVTTGNALATILGATPTPVPSPQPLRLTALCSPDSATIHAWKVENPNAFETWFGWRYASSGLDDWLGTGVVGAASGETPGVRLFTTTPQSQAGAISIYSPSDVLQDTKDANTDTCTTATPSLTPTPVP